MEDLIDESFKPQQFNALLMGLFSALALLYIFRKVAEYFRISC
jgi:hypothetical protein